MSYLVLARKYRPQLFEDVVGQDHVTRTLANAITAERVAHAYLFCGPRGVGKTTAARILAKAMNCADGPTSTPCNVCTPCLEITGGRSLDVLEIDGASNRGINEVRELRENTRYAASGGRSKVYIIDEVHMLTNEAFNALLKTLEEPPPHVIFVLATTEPFKLPATILSRCQRFDFARIPAREIAAHLLRLMESENITAEPDAAALVARRAQGGLRDALSLMDQVIASADGPIDRPSVERILGLVGSDVFEAFVECMASEDSAAALSLLHTIYTRGADLGEVAEGLSAHLRDLFLLRLEGNLEALIEAPEADAPRLHALANRFDPETLSSLLERAAQAAVDLRRSDHPLLVMELALAEMCRTAGRVSLTALTERLAQLEQVLCGEAVPVARREVPRKPTTAAAPVAPTPGAPTAPRTPVAAARPATAMPATAAVKAPSAPRKGETEADRVWRDCLDALRGHSMRLWGTFHDAQAVELTDGTLTVRATGNPALLTGALDEAECKQLFATLLEGLGVKRGSVVLAGASKPASAKPAPAKPAVAVQSDPAKRPESTTDRPEAKAPAPAEPVVASSGETEGKAKPKPKKPTAAPDERSMGDLFREEPILQKALDMFEGEVLP